MANKILLKHKGDVNDFYEPSDSENEYTEHEKKLLQKVRKGRHRSTDPEQEILAFNQQDDDDDDDEQGDDYASDDDDFGEKFQADSDIESDDNDGIPDSRAWGNKRRDFHSTDFVDQDYSSYNQREEDLAEQEETEARAIQQRLAKQLNESDFSLDIFAPAEKSKQKQDANKKTDEIFMRKDLSQLSQRQKEQLFKKESPEFEGLVQDFRQRLNDSIELLEPVLTYCKENGVENHPLAQFVMNQNQLILNYCTNVSFYLVLKAKRIPIQNHPVAKRLVKIRQLLLQIDEKYTSTVKPQLEKIVESIRDGTELPINKNEAPTEKKDKKKLRFVERLENDGGDRSEDKMESAIEKADAMDFKRKLKLLESDSEQETGNGDEEEINVNNVNGENDDDDDDERRQITYQMAKNKGLTPYRKKELRNPRVKHRNKFRKALIRRKGAHRTVRKEIKRYDGEKFGIKASVKKGIKIK